MASLDPSVLAELHTGFAEDFDGIKQMSLTKNFTGQVQQVESNFDVAGQVFGTMTQG